VQNCFILNNHLRNTLPTQRLAPHETLSLHSSKSVESSCDQQKDSGNDQARSVADDAQPLHKTHDSIYGCAHVVCGKTADEGIECGRGGTDAKEKGNFDKDEDEAANAREVLVR
jgi:hypothetical protein